MRTIKALHWRGNLFYQQGRSLRLYYANNLLLEDGKSYYLLLDGDWIVQALPVD